MSLRLIKKTRMNYPAEHAFLAPLVMGAEGEGDPAQDDTEEDAEDDSEEDEKDSSKDEESELEKVKRRMKAADRRAAEAERKAREYEDKDKTDLELATKKASELETENEKLQGQLRVLTQERYFLGSNTVTWHDPEIAMSKIKWDDIIDEDGEVDKTSLERAIKDLAKSKPFLVKSDNPSDEGGKPADNAGQASGGKVGSGKKQTKQELDREQLLRRFPALR
jgi:hypothetical protein